MHRMCQRLSACSSVENPSDRENSEGPAPRSLGRPSSCAMTLGDNSRGQYNKRNAIAIPLLFCVRLVTKVDHHGNLLEIAIPRSKNLQVHTAYRTRS